MLDGLHSYSIVYDREDLDSDPEARHGTRLIRADWQTIRADPEAVGLWNPVLVRQFFAQSFEQASREWYALRGLPRYKAVCLHPGHGKDPETDWLTDDSVCAGCYLSVVLQQALVSLLGTSSSQKGFILRLQAAIRYSIEHGPLAPRIVSIDVDAQSDKVSVTVTTDIPNKVYADASFSWT